MMKCFLFLNTFINNLRNKYIRVWKNNFFKHISNTKEIYLTSVNQDPHAVHSRIGQSVYTTKANLENKSYHFLKAQYKNTVVPTLADMSIYLFMKKYFTNTSGQSSPHNAKFAWCFTTNELVSLLYNLICITTVASAACV